MAGSKSRLAVMALTLFFMSGCTYTANPPATLASNVYSIFEAKIPGRFLYSFDETSWGKLMIEDSISGFQCSFHYFPVDARNALKGSIDKSMPLIFENAERASSPPTADAMRRRGITGHVIFKIEDFRSDLSYAPKFFSSDATARIDLSVGVVVISPTGRLLATAVSASRMAREDSFFFCEGGNDALERATSDTMREVLERLGDRLSNSQKIRHAATGTPVSPSIMAGRSPFIAETRPVSPPLIENNLKSNKKIGNRNTPAAPVFHGTPASRKSFASYTMNELQTLALGGNPEGQFILGKKYFDGDGVSKDLDRAINYLKAASNQQHAQAQLTLGIIYFYGWGGTIDLTQAKHWFKLAQQNGVRDADYYLEKLKLI